MDQDRTIAPRQRFEIPREKVEVTPVERGLSIIVEHIGAE